MARGGDLFFNHNGSQPSVQRKAKGIVNMIKKRFTSIITLICALIVIDGLAEPIFNRQLLWAQFSEIPIKAIPLPVGSGARALGQGGAFIAVADDATAASWNPAGLIQLERPEASIVGAYLLTDQDFSADSNSGLGDMLGDEDVGRWDVNFMSMAYPFRFLRKNFVAALNYHQVLDFHADINFDQSALQLKFPRSVVNQEIGFKSSGGIGALSPGIAMLLLPKLAFGLTVNIFDDEFFSSHGWTESITTTGKGDTSNTSPFFNDSRQKTSSDDYHGANVSLGLLWDIWEKEDKNVTFGAVFHSSYTARFDQKITSSSQTRFIGSGLFLSPTSFDTESRMKMDWPMSFGIGLGYRHTDALSFSFDVAWTDWSEWVRKEKTVKANGERIGLSESGGWLNSRPIGGGSEHDEIDDTYAVRFGTEYLIFRKKEVIALRGGLFYEPRPSIGSVSEFDRDGNPTGFTGDPTDVWGFSLGTGITTERFSIDAAYQFRYVRDMEFRDMGPTGADIDAIENLFLTSLIVYF